jgi:hypothetical protein
MLRADRFSGIDLFRGVAISSCTAEVRLRVRTGMVSASACTNRYSPASARRGRNCSAAASRLLASSDSRRDQFG